MITSVAVTFIGGKRMLSVDIDFQSAVTMDVPDARHCAELLAILWPGPELEPLRDRMEMAAKGGGIGMLQPTDYPSPGGAGRRGVTTIETQG